MILTCPSCGTRYQTDSARIAPPGRNVRCAKCKEVWFQAVPEKESEPEPEPVIVVPEPETRVETVMTSDQPSDVAGERITSLPSMSDSFADTHPQETRRRGGRFGQIAGWAALVLLVVAIGWSVVQYRQTIAQAWPQSASLYAAIGLPVNLRGIALTDVTYKQDFEDGQPVLSVTGKVVNISDREQPVPEIRVVITDESHRELYHWTFDAGVPSLRPGAESSFMTRLSSPPADARNLDVRFAEAGEPR
jgi:predicted Zn finger-like uncharacterized protein